MKTTALARDGVSTEMAGLISRLRYTSMTAKTVYDALVEKGWPAESLPKTDGISPSILNGYFYNFLILKFLQIIALQGFEPVRKFNSRFREPRVKK